MRRDQNVGGWQARGVGILPMNRESHWLEADATLNLDHAPALALPPQFVFPAPVSITKIPELWKSLWKWLAALPDLHAFRAALAIWALVGVIVFTIVAIDPMGRSATKEYQNASTRWWQEKNIYKGKNNYLYLPQWAMLYTPFNVLPRPVGEPLWRLVGLGTLAFALWSGARHLAPKKAGAIFLVASALILPCSLASARNGQVNMPLAGLYLLVAIALARERWHLTAILLAVTLALKPISIVPILLCGALYPRLILPLILWLAVMFGAAWLHPDPQFVTGQYRAFFDKLINSAANPGGHTWSDYAGMLKSFGLTLPDRINFLIRTVFAALTLGLCFLALRTSDALRRALTIMLFAVIYLMLFNPRTETNSYVIPGIFIALLAAWEGLIRKNFAATAIWVLFAFALGNENYGGYIYYSTNLWLKPLATLALGIWLAARVIRLSRGESAVFSPAPLSNG